MTRLHLVAAALATVAVAIHISHSSKSNSAESRVGRFTSAEIIAKSKPICDALNTWRFPMQYSAQEVDAGPACGAIRRIWLVDAVDPMYGYEQHLIWSADSGELLSTSQSAHQCTAVYKIPRSRTEAQ